MAAQMAEDFLLPERYSGRDHLGGPPEQAGCRSASRRWYDIDGVDVLRMLISSVAFA